jgi:Uma2 family endonuclease
MSATTTLMTFEEFERLPDGPGKDELLNGEHIHLPPPFLDHMLVVHRLYEMLKAVIQQAGASPGLGDVFIEMGYRTGTSTWLRPDVSIAHDRQAHGNYFEGAPALAVEVISKSNTATEINQKVTEYLRNGSIEVWLFYSKTRSVWVFRAGRAQEFRNVLESDLIPGMKLDLERIFDANPVG